MADYGTETKRRRIPITHIRVERCDKGHRPWTFDHGRWKRTETIGNPDDGTREQPIWGDPIFDKALTATFNEQEDRLIKEAGEEGGYVDG